LGGINSKLVGHAVLFDDGILSEGGSSIIHGPINKSSIGSVSISTQIGSRDVVSQSNSTSAVVGFNAGEFVSLGHGPVVVVSMTSSSSVSEMVVSGEGGSNAVGSSNSVGGNFGPFEGLLKALSLVVGGGLDTSIVDADGSGFDVLRFGLVELAPFLIVSHDGNIPPWGRSPVGVVISLFGAFISVSVSIVVLSGGDGGIVVQISIIDPQSLVSVSGLASNVELSGLVHSKLGFTVSIEGGRSIGIIGNSIGGGTISNQFLKRSILGRAHVLENHVAVQFLVLSASMLSSPFNREKRTFVVIHGRTPAKPAFGVVLGIHKSVGVVSVSIRLIESSVRPTRVLHVQIAESLHGKEENQGRGYLHLQGS
jgi:hypothetical protein